MFVSALPDPTCNSEKSANGGNKQILLLLLLLLLLEVNEKEQAPLGQRTRAVGMCFYKKGDLKKGNNYQLRRNRDNPKDTNCFEVRSQHITMATMNMNFSCLLAPFVDENIIWELTW